MVALKNRLLSGIARFVGYGVALVLVTLVRSVLYSAIFVLGAFVILTTDFGEDPEVAYHRIEANSGPLIQALDDYREVNHSYPQNLDFLVPIYLQSLPETGWGCDAWEYLQLSDGTYQLAVLKRKNNYEGYYYLSNEGEWYGDF